MAAPKRPAPGGTAAAGSKPAAKPKAAAKPTPKAAPGGPSAASADEPPSLAAGLADHGPEGPSGPSASASARSATDGASPKASAFAEIGGATPGERPWEAAGPTGEAMLRLAAVHTACLTLSDAANHLRRTAVTVEAANAVALRRSLTASKGDDGWILAIEGAERVMKDAIDSYQRTTVAALDLVKQAPGGR